MTTVVKPTIDKLMPPIDPAPPKSAPKQEKSSFDQALDDAKPKPKPKPADAKPVAKKKPAHTKPKKEAKKTDPKEDDSKDQTDAVQTEAAADGVTADDVATDDVADADVAADVPDAQGKAKETKSEAAPVADSPAPDQATLAQDAAQAVQVKVASPDKSADVKADPKAEDAGDKEVAIRTDGKTAPLKKAPVAIAKKAKTTVADSTDDADTEAADDSSDTDTTATDDHQPTAKVAKKPAMQSNANSQPADKPAPVDLGAQVQSTKPTATQQASTPSTDDDGQQPVQAASDLTDHDDAAAPPDDASAAAHLDSATATLFDLQPKSPTPPTPTSVHAAPTPTPEPPAPPEVRFADANHPQIVSNIRGELLPDGGTMHIRLDPPELGAVQVSVHMQDGVMSASFQTSNDDATRMLSHSLAQLKHVLESQGVSVDKLHVTQAPRDQEARNDDNRQQGNPDNPQAKQEQQRREILNRMWERLRNGSDPVDMLV